MTDELSERSGAIEGAPNLRRCVLCAAARILYIYKSIKMFAPLRLSPGLRRPVGGRSQQLCCRTSASSEPVGQQLESWQVQRLQDAFRAGRRQVPVRLCWRMRRLRPCMRCSPASDRWRGPLAGGQAFKGAGSASAGRPAVGKGTARGRQDGRRVRPPGRPSPAQLAATRSRLCLHTEQRSALILHATPPP